MTPVIAGWSDRKKLIVKNKKAKPKPTAKI